MIKNYIVIAYRNFIRHKSDTIINVAGLALGIAATILILLYVQFEFSYDDFHRDADNIYRISVIHKSEGKTEYDSPYFTPPIGPAMKANFPEVIEYTRIRAPRSAYFLVENKSFKINNILYADSTFLNMFNFPLLHGDKKNALAAPYSIILSEDVANRLFGDEDPVGRTISYEKTQDYIITGIIENSPQNSHLQYSALISFSTLYQNPNLYLDWNGGNQYVTYVRLQASAKPQDVNSKFPALMWDPINKLYATVGAELMPYLQPLSDIHLYHNPYSGSLRRNLYIFILISIIILLIACINFINLTTARSIQRAKEIAMRKVLGAKKENIRVQFLFEVAMLCILSITIALVIVEMIFPIYTHLVGKNLNHINLTDSVHWTGIFGLFIIVSLLAGGYPSFYLARLPVLRTIKGLRNIGSLKSIGRNSLVILQFTISAILIISTSIINQQINFMRTKSLGFEKDNIVVLPLETDEVKLKSTLLKNDLSALPDVVSVSASSEVPSNGFTSNGYIPEGYTTAMMINVVDVDEDFLKTFGLNLLQGRNFLTESPADDNAYLINKTLAEDLGWNSPLAKKIVRNGEHQIIGIVDDFHFSTLHDKIGPLIITNKPERNRFNLLSIKINSTDIPETIAAIINIWDRHVPGTPCNYYFLDDRFDELYKTEQKLHSIILYFSVLAIFIASLGLYALASFIIQQKTKEIGIRKVLGATASAVTRMVTGDYLKLVLIANLLAIPVAWFLMDNWLQNFAYRVSPGWWIFIISGCITLIIALVTVIFKSIRAAISNPVEALRYE